MPQAPGQAVFCDRLSDMKANNAEFNNAGGNIITNNYYSDGQPTNPGPPKHNRVPGVQTPIRKPTFSDVVNWVMDFTKGTLGAAAPALEKSKHRLGPTPYLYARCMIEDKPYGYPLYRPEPNKSLPTSQRMKGVRVGDVGVFTQDGSFDVLFNVWKHYKDTNESRVPTNFETIDVELSIDAIFQPNTSLLTKAVTPARECDVPNFYECPRDAGAILELPQGATCYEARNKLAFNNQATAHAEDWYRYARFTRQWDAPNGSLYVVTGCIKSNSWGIAVFGDHSDSGRRAQFISNGSPMHGRNAQDVYDWKLSDPASAVADIGPRAEPLFLTTDSEENQCVFLRGFCITLNDAAWMALKPQRTILGSTTLGYIASGWSRFVGR